MHLDTLDTTLISRQMLTSDTAQLVLRAPGHTFNFEPGQHVGVAYESDDGLVHRSYSPVSLPGTDTLALMVTRYEDGTCSVWLHEREIGKTIQLTDPSGNLSLRDPERDVVFLATGTGLTPMLAMLQAYRQTGTGRATLIYGERTLADVPYRETLNLWAAGTDRLDVTYALSHSDDTPDRSSEATGPGDTAPSGIADIRHGYVQTHLGGMLDPETLQTAYFYACGVPQMVVDTEETLTGDLGVDEDRVFTEGWEAGAID
jgi:glycine betaine catabolism B